MSENEDQPKSTKVPIHPGDLDGEGMILALAHPDSQKSMIAKQRRPDEVVPRSLDEAAAIVAIDPFHDFVMGQAPVYLTAEAIGKDTYGQIEGHGRMRLGGELGTWKNIPAQKVDKPHGGGFAFGRTANASPTRKESRSEAGVNPETTEKDDGGAGIQQKEDQAQQGPTVSKPGDDGLKQMGMAGSGGETSPSPSKPRIHFLEDAQPLGAPEPYGGSRLIDVHRDGGAEVETTKRMDELAKELGSGKKIEGGTKSHAVTMPKVRMRRGGDEATPRREHEEAAQKGKAKSTPTAGAQGGLPAWAGALAAGVGLFVAVTGWTKPVRTKVYSPKEYLQWETRELGKEIKKRWEQHERDMKSGKKRPLELEAEEREVAAMTAAWEVLRARRK